MMSRKETKFDWIALCNAGPTNRDPQPPQDADSEPCPLLARILWSHLPVSLLLAAVCLHGSSNRLTEPLSEIMTMEGLGTPHAPHAPSLPSSSFEAFNRILAGLPKKKNTKAVKFVKRLDDIPVISLPPETPIQVALSLAKTALISQFTGLWPSPKTIESCVNRNWAPLIKESVTSYFLGRGYFLFEFTSKEDKDLIFQNGPYFMGP